MPTTLQTNRQYVLPNTYIGEDIQPGTVSVAPETRVPTYVGKGSPYTLKRNSGITRGFINNHGLSFSSSSPYTALLDIVSNGDLDVATLSDSTGLEVVKDQWRFLADGSGVVIADAAYNAAASYSISYQGNDTSVPDAIPVPDIRVIDTIGSQLDQNQYKRNVDYFLDVTTSAPVPAVDVEGNIIKHTKSTFSFSSVTQVGTGTGLVTVNAYAQYAHLYNRQYVLTVKTVVGTVVTLAWQASPLEAGNSAAPRVPVAAGVNAPTIEIDTTNEQTLSAVLEYGIRLDFSSTGTYVVNDTYTFSAYGPSLIEVHSAILNDNQFAESGPVLASLDNVGTGSLVVDAAGFYGSANLSFKAQVTAVDSGSTAATLPTGKVVFSAVAPPDGSGIVFNNGRTGASKVVKTFEFDSNSIQSIPGSTLVVLPQTAAVAATGLIAFPGTSSTTLPVDGSYIALGDGVRTVVFEFDDNGIVNNAGATKVIVGATSAATAANLVTAINASALRITATDSSAGGIGAVALAAQVAGVIGNATVTAVDFDGTITGMSGGADAHTNVAGSITNFIAAVNASTLGLVAVVDDADAYTVHLRPGATLLVPSNPADGAVFTVVVGGTSTTFEFEGTGGVVGGNTAITIGLTLADTLANVVTAVSALTGVLAVAHAASVVIAPETARNITVSSPDFTVTPTVVDDSTSSNNGNSALLAVNGLVGVALVGFSGGVDATYSPDRVTVAWGCAGDLFARGNVVLTDGAKLEVFQGATVALGKTAATPASGTVSLTGLPSDTNTVTISDGIITPVVFEFDSNSTVSGSNTAVTIAATAELSAANLAAKVNASALSISAAAVGASVVLTHKKNGAGPSGAYNVAITRVGDAISVVGMAGGKSNYAVGDTFAFSVLAARKFSLALDDRTTVLTVAQVGTATDATAVVFNYEANTAEGGFGTVTADTASGGYITLPGQISLAVRNRTSFAVGDKFSVEHVNNGRLFWNLNAKATQSFTTSDVLVDRNGSVTGTFGAFYIALSAAPLAGTLSAVLGGLPFAGLEQVRGGNIVRLAISSPTDLAATLTVSYTHVGNEPAIGSTYYISGRYKRPASSYNTPTLFYDLPSALEFLAPVTADNDLAIAATLAFDQNQPPLAIAVIQVQDADDDGIFAPADIQNALNGAKEVLYITDLVPLRLYAHLPKFLSFNVSSCDPFEKREHMLYVGAPIGMPVGDASAPGSLVYLSKQTLQVFGTASYAHGTRILVAPRKATKTMSLSDNTVATVTLDGSFVAAAVAACVAGAPTYSQTLLKSQLLGFDTVETFGNSTNIKLGAANTIFFADAGNGVYTFAEDQTTDTYAAEFHEILPMRQKQDVTRIVRREMDARVIGMVPNTKGDAKADIASVLVDVLGGLVSRGVTAPYQDADGNARQISSADVRVFPDANDPTLYHFYYTFYTRFAIKRLFGLYAVNKSIQG